MSLPVQRPTYRATDIYGQPIANAKLTPETLRLLAVFWAVVSESAKSDC